jgi:bifunctional ADP-heptose synthase (sugar kinase/adenylyltransferase)
MSLKKKKVLVSGCFDMLHSEQVAFLSEATKDGRVSVGLGSDKTIQDLKGRDTINSEDERLYMLSSLECVHNVKVYKEVGSLIFYLTRLV